MDCTNCQQPVSVSDTFCGNCGAPVEASRGGIVLERGAEPVLPTAPPTRPVAEFTQPPPQAIQNDPREVPFRLAYDERILKTYQAVVLRTPFFKRKRGRGTLYVTDARLVFFARVDPRGTQRISRLVQQTKLEDISGMSVYVTRRISLPLLILTGFFALATIGSLLTFFLPAVVLFALLTALFGVFLMADAANRGRIGVVIKSREMATSPINFGFKNVGAMEGIARILLLPFLIFFPSYSAFDVLEGDPAEDADQLVHELGALILDLQTRGTTAYGYWGMIEDGSRPRAAGHVT